MTTAILLTAAVTPSPLVSVALADPAVRRQQYLDAWRFWVTFARASGSALWLVETSGADSAAFDALAGRGLGERYRFVRFTPSASAERRGKGSIESDAIDAALRSIAPDDDVAVYKATGRYTVANAAAIVRPLPRDRVVVRRHVDRGYIDTRLLGAPAGVWRTTFAGMGPLCDDDAGRYVEHVAAQRLITAEYEGSVLATRFPVRPAMRGVSGTRGVRYGGPLLQLKERLTPAVDARLERLSRSKFI